MADTNIFNPNAVTSYDNQLFDVIASLPADRIDNRLYHIDRTVLPIVSDFAAVNNNANLELLAATDNVRNQLNSLTINTQTATTILELYSGNSRIGYLRIAAANTSGAFPLGFTLFLPVNTNLYLKNISGGAVTISYTMFYNLIRV